MASNVDPSVENSEGQEAVLTIRGLSNIARGHAVGLEVGGAIVVGRSRQCDWSLRRSPQYLHCTDAQRARINQDLAFNTVSREHARITYIAPGMVEIRNLSGNGTLVDGKRVDRIVLTDCETRAHQIQLGPMGVTVGLGPS